MAYSLFKCSPIQVLTSRYACTVNLKILYACMSEVGLPSQARISNLNTTTRLCVMLVHALSLYCPLTAESYAAINNMPHPPQYGITPTIIGELIALNSRGGRALELRMRKKKHAFSSDCSPQDCVLNVRTFASNSYLEDSSHFWHPLYALPLAQGTRKRFQCIACYSFK